MPPVKFPWIDTMVRHLRLLVDADEVRNRPVITFPDFKVSFAIIGLLLSES